MTIFGYQEATPSIAACIVVTALLRLDGCKRGVDLHLTICVCCRDNAVLCGVLELMMGASTSVACRALDRRCEAGNTSPAETWKNVRALSLSVHSSACQQSCNQGSDGCRFLQPAGLFCWLVPGVLEVIFACKWLSKPYLALLCTSQR